MTSSSSQVRKYFAQQEKMASLFKCSLLKSACYKLKQLSIIAVMHEFLNPKGHQTVLNSLMIGKGLGTREHLFISVKITYIFG
jgi:hypothetical protein